MEELWDRVSEHLPLVLAGGTLLFSWIAGIAVRKLLLRQATRLTSLTSSEADDVVLGSLGRPLPLWFFLGGMHLVPRIVEMPERLASITEKIVLSLFILSMTFWAAGLAARLLPVGLGGPGTAGATGAVRYVVKGIVLAVGGLVLLSTLGISVTPVLTTVGVGGLAVALGLQETLSNLFAGIQITLTGNIRVGDFIKLESGEEGYVEDIHWRSTRVRTLPNNFVTIPNSRLAQSVVTNYHLPSKDIAVLVQVGVHYSSDLEHVERIVHEVARSVLQTIPGGVRDFDPFIRYHTFGASSIDFTVILRAEEFKDTFLVKHEFIKALARAFAKEGIVIPFPIRAINLDQEKAELRTARSGS